MKKMLLIVAVAFAAMSCGNKNCEQKCCEGEAAPAAEAVEVVEAPACDSAAVEAPVEAPAEAPVGE